MKEREKSVEFLRIFSIIMVIIVHVSSVYYNGFNKTSFSYFIIGSSFNIIARVCVPLFFMISGIFLTKEPFDKTKYKKRIIKFSLILVLWSIIYYIYNGLIYNRDLLNNLPSKIVYTLFKADYTQPHLWYLYALLGIYIALPFIQDICKNMTREKEILFLKLWLFFSGVVPILLSVANHLLKTSIEIEYPIPLINGTYYLGYFICGHIIYERLQKYKLTKKDKIYLVLAIIFSNILMILITGIASSIKGSLFSTMTWYRNILVSITSASVFTLVIGNKSKFKSQWILNISKYTFGIYLIHMILLNPIKSLIIRYNPLLSIPLITIVIFSLSLLIVFILKKIKYIKNVI